MSSYSAQVSPALLYGKENQWTTLALRFSVEFCRLRQLHDFVSCKVVIITVIGLGQAHTSCR